MPKRAKITNQSNPSLVFVPVIGNAVYDETYQFALYDLLEKNPGYDVVFYPQFTKTVKGPLFWGLFVKHTTVTVTARLGKIKTE